MAMASNPASARAWRLVKERRVIVPPIRGEASLAGGRCPPARYPLHTGPGRMRFVAARDADDQSCRENDLCGGVGDDPDRGEGRGRLADGESLSPGLEGGLAHAVGGAEGGDRLARGLPASNEV